VADAGANAANAASSIAADVVANAKQNIVESSSYLQNSANSNSANSNSTTTNTNSVNSPTTLQDSTAAAHNALQKSLLENTNSSSGPLFHVQSKSEERAQLKTLQDHDAHSVIFKASKTDAAEHARQKKPSKIITNKSMLSNPQIAKIVLFESSSSPLAKK
jgi:hypothetical protein